MKYIEILIVLCLSQVFLTQARAQYIWDITRPVDSRVAIEYKGFSTFGESCTVAGTFLDSKKNNISFFCIHSTDGGRTWTEQDLGLKPSYWATHLQVTGAYQMTPLTAFVIGDSGLIVKTNDGGLHWTKQHSPDSTMLPHQILFRDSLNGVIVSDRPSMIAATSDGGLHWNVVSHQRATECYFHPGGGSRMFDFNTGTIYYLDTAWSVFDSSSRLPALLPGTNNKPLIGYCLFAGDTVWGVGTLLQRNDKNVDTADAGLLVRSLDGGKHWEEPLIFHEINAGLSLNSISSDTFYAAGGVESRAMVVSFDRGDSWHVDSMRLRTPSKPNTIVSIVPMPDGHPLAMMSEGFGARTVFAVGSPFLNHVDRAAPSVDSTYVYPNPAVDQVCVASKNETGPIYLMDILGREVLRDVSSDRGNVTFDVSQLPRGVYSVMLEKDGRMVPMGKVAVVGR